MLQQFSQLHFLRTGLSWSNLKKIGQRNEASATGDIK